MKNLAKLLHDKLHVHIMAATIIYVGYMWIFYFIGNFIYQIMDYTISDFAFMLVCISLGMLLIVSTYYTIVELGGWIDRNKDRL